MAMKNTKKAKVALIEINESALCVKMQFVVLSLRFTDSFSGPFSNKYTLFYNCTLTQKVRGPFT